MQKAYKVVLVGMGKRGMHHADAFRNSPRFELSGICDTDPAVLVKSAEVFDANVLKISNASDLVARVGPDVFCFCTPPVNA